ncbi:MAG TPA: alpha/beta fold hydrolase, partial [Pyrinomonadaceae bacterium]|nr:alpha/beta fold hydrolase [Pyrinomonadaceae bacterium]
AGYAQSNSTSREQASVPRFEKSSCAVKIPEGIRAECGNLFVKENRSKANSRLIRLPVVIIKSTSPNPAPDPIFYTGGGPGGGSLGRAQGARNLAPYTKDRDFIIFEQRGTRLAEPSMPCPEVNEADHTAPEKNLNDGQARKTEMEAVRNCRDRLIREGIDLAAYDSAASAADIEDLRRALGIEQWNLYGVSYSTRLMLNYIREYPASVRSVILDSVLPPTVNYDETSVDGVMRSLNLIFDTCAADAHCHSTYPDIRKKFYGLVKIADEKPLEIKVNRNGTEVRVYADGKSVVDFVYGLLENTDALSDIPFIINTLASGNYASLISFKRFGEQKLTSEGFVWGMRYSVWCSEEMPFQDVRKIRGQLTKYKGLRGFGIQSTFPEICKAWNVPAAGKIENTPVKSNIPALIFSGEYDPDTPPAWGKLVSTWFPNSYFYEVKNTSHGVLFGNRCAIVDVAPSFLNDPMKRPNDGCLDKIGPMVFK